MLLRTVSPTVASQFATGVLDEHANDRPPAAVLAASPTRDQGPWQTVAARNTNELAIKGKFNFLAILHRQSGTGESRLKIKGFSAADLQRLECLSTQDRLFVIHQHARLKELCYKPLDMLHLAVQSQHNRDFVLNSGHLLGIFTPTEISSCALLRSDQRDFILLHYEEMHRLGFSSRDMFRLASAPPAHLLFITRHWHSLIGTRLKIDQLHLFARMPERTRNLLMANFGVFHSRDFSPHEWTQITGFDDHQCYRLIREYRSVTSQSFQDLLAEIGQDARASKWPENLKWLDETSRASIQRWLAYTHAKEDSIMTRISTLCSEVMSSAFLARLHEDPEAQPLGALVAGLVFTATYAKSPELAKRSTRAMLRYIEEKNKSKLWGECQAEAKDAIEGCGDRVEYGLSRILQAIEKYKMIIGELPPKEALLSVLRLFNREQVEVAAQTIAIEKGVEFEGIEVYLNLGSQLAQRGLDLGVLPVGGRYIDLPQYAVSPSRVVLVENELVAHRRNYSPEFRSAFEENLSVQFALRNLFSVDYEAMIKQRESAEDEATNIMLAQSSTDEAREASRSKLIALSGAERNWYNTKLQQVLTDMNSH
jgi:hypothetical protein